MAQVYFDVNSFSGAEVLTDRGQSLDAFYYEAQNICRMKLSSAEKQAAFKLLTEQLFTAE